MRTSAISPFLPFLVGLYIWVLAFSASPVWAADLPVVAGALARIPVPLQPWVSWALHEPVDWRCPVDYAHVQRRQCFWLSSLSLDLHPQGGTFRQQVRNDMEGWLTLPGDRRYWPQDVRFDEQPVPVLERDGQPVLKAIVGDHQITGYFFWHELPESLRIPAGNGLLDLQVNGQPLAAPRLEESGTLWLRQRPTTTAQQDQLDLQVFRLLSDGVPFIVTTRLELSVSGQAREEWLGPVLLPDFLPLALDSPLPAHLEADGRLRVQLSPGVWTITLTARHLGPVEALKQSPSAAPWPAQEIWSFQAYPALRVVQIEGALAIDPQQTHLPEDWRRWPAYLLLQPEGELRFQMRERGDAESLSERLNLERTLWLDFAGGGYTVQDHLSGSLKNTRLDAAPELLLGRVAINGEDQWITTLPGVDGTGVEIRQLDPLQLVADSRLESAAVDDVPAVGWRITPQHIQTTLHLPPGWRLLAAAGPDSISGAWLYTWNLLDLFVVLIIAFGFAKLWNKRWGMVALLGMALTYHEPNAPLFIWLNVLAAVALLRVLPPGRFYHGVNLYRRLALFALLVISTLFAIQQVRSALYPQLAPEMSAISFNPLPQAVAPATPPIPAPSTNELNSQQRSLLIEEQRSAKAEFSSLSSSFQKKYVTDMKVQTGPGLPVWHWRQAVLRWNGPTAAEERLRLWLLLPWQTRILLLVGLGLLLVMGMRVFRADPPKPSQPIAPNHAGDSPPTGHGSAVVLALLLGGVLISGSPAAHADFPSPELLKELREQLTEPPDCQRCGDLAALALDIQHNALQVRLTLHAQTDTAIPLPLPRQGLIIRAIELDGQPAVLSRDAEQQLWLRLPAGLHTAVFAAAVPETVATLQLPLPMAPGHMEFVADGWQVEGYVEGRADRQIQLTRQRQTNGAPLSSGVIPSFVQVERTLILDVDWQVQTKVRRLSQADSAAVLEIPLLFGERVTTPGIQVRDERVLLNLPPDQTEITWTASLNRTDSLALHAAEASRFVEVWRLRANPLWHVQNAGVPLVSRIDGDGQWSPEWRPWPGETLALTISRPEGAPGASVTIDQSDLRLTLGQRLSEAHLEMTLRTSRGAEQTVTLPQGMTLTALKNNGVAQPLPPQGQPVVLPLTPGVQRVVLAWREEQSIGARYKTPVVHLGSPSVNARLTVQVPRDRWLLWVSGPTLGPAVLFWGVLCVILIGALVLARIGNTPLRTLHWFLLGVGLSQSHVLVICLVAGWLLLLGRRGMATTWPVGNLAFNLQQLALVVLTVAALSALLGAIEQGLLGTPDMQVIGNDSNAYRLQWYQDRAIDALPIAEIISAPILLYRGLMLMWSLWLAYALLRWLSWGWTCFSLGGLWRPLRQKKNSAEAG